MDSTLYITGAGISAESGIPTFRGHDGYWTIGSKNYTPQEMATRQTYQQHCFEFLSWYYHRFASYRHHGPNSTHHWLADKNVITQNVDGLDAKAGNKNYIAIHGRLDKMARYCPQDEDFDIIDTPWDKIDDSSPTTLKQSLFEVFHIDQQTQKPVLHQAYKPFILLFDEYYSPNYRMQEAEERMWDADKMVFMGTSFSVNITNIALQIAIQKQIPVEVVDPEPQQLPYDQVSYFRMPASQYCAEQE